MFPQHERRHVDLLQLTLIMGGESDVLYYWYNVKVGVEMCTNETEEQRE